MMCVLGGELVEIGFKVWIGLEAKRCTLQVRERSFVDDPASAEFFSGCGSGCAAGEWIKYKVAGVR